MAMPELVNIEVFSSVFVTARAGGFEPIKHARLVRMRVLLCGLDMLPINTAPNAASVVQFRNRGVVTDVLPSPTMGEPSFTVLETSVTASVQAAIPKQASPIIYGSFGMKSLKNIHLVSIAQ